MIDYEKILQKNLQRRAKFKEKKQTQIHVESIRKKLAVGLRTWYLSKDAKVIKITKSRVYIEIETGEQGWVSIAKYPSLRIPIRHSKYVPKELLEIQSWWDEQVDRYVSQKKQKSWGSVVGGAGITFEYQSQYYRLTPNSKHQGEFTWSHCKDDVLAKLSDLDCQNIHYDPGWLD